MVENIVKPENVMDWNVIYVFIAIQKELNQLEQKNNWFLYKLINYSNIKNMYIRVNNITFSSKIEADAMKSLAKHEMINTIPGIISIESIEISETQSVVILKFDSKESAEKSKAIYINKMKENPNIKIQSFEGPRDFIREKS